MNLEIFFVSAIVRLKLFGELHHEFRRIIAFTLACTILFSRALKKQLHYLRF
jgi:hypothetical protein